TLFPYTTLFRSPLLGMPHRAGVLLVGAIVIVIVASAGMASTTYVPFLKGGLLIGLSTVLTFYMLKNGLRLSPETNSDGAYHSFMAITPEVVDGEVLSAEGWEVLGKQAVGEKTFVKLAKSEIIRWFDLVETSAGYQLKETLSIIEQANGPTL